MILVLILAIPAVQTQLGKLVTQKINEDYNTQIFIGRVGLQFNGDVELKDILIKDYKNNPFIRAEELNTSILNFKKITDNTLAFGDIDIYGLLFDLKTYKDEEKTNLDVFIEKFNTTDPDKPETPFLLSTSDITISNSTFNLSNYNLENANMLLLNNLYINATNLIVNGPNVNMRINNLKFDDSRGVSIENFSTNFSYTINELALNNLAVVTKNSELKGELKFLYKLDDFSNFVDSVKVQAKFTKADILLDELNKFYNEFGTQERVVFTTEVNGYLNDLTLLGLELETSSNSRIDGTINFKNMFSTNANDFEMQANLSNLSSNYYKLKSLLPNVLGNSIPSAFERLQNFTLKGATKITTKSILANFNMSTSLGRITSNLKLSNIDEIDFASYTGNIVLEDFDVGAFIDNEDIKQTTLNLDVDGKGFTANALNTNITGTISKLLAYNYEYSNIDVSGTLKDNIYQGKLVSNDDNLKLTFDGLADLSKDVKSLDFNSTVEYANLSALNIIKTDSISMFSGKVSMKMAGSTIDDAVGGMIFNDAKYTGDRGTYTFEDLLITSSITDGVRRVIFNSPDVIQGVLSGKFKFKNIESLVTNAFNNLYASQPIEASQIEEKEFIDFDFEIYNKIVELFFPNIKLSPNTAFNGHISSDTKKVNLKFKSPEISLYQYFAKNIELQIDNENPLFNTYVEIDSINTKFYNASKFTLINANVNDTLFVRSEFKGGVKTLSDNFNLNVYHTITNDNKTIVGLKQSDIFINGNEWILNPNRDKKNKIEFSDSFNNLAITNFLARHEDEEITLTGEVIGALQKNITAEFNAVNINKIIPKDIGFNLDGLINGNVNLIQEQGGYIPKADITIKDLVVNAIPFGNFETLITGNSQLSQYNIDASIKNDVTTLFSANGQIDTSGNQSAIDLDVNFDGFSLAFLNPLLEDVLENISGELSGGLKVSGNLSKPDMAGTLSIANGGLGIPYLGVHYNFDENAEIAFKNQRLSFNRLAMTDSEFATIGELDGYLEHNNFATWAMDLTIDSERLLVLNTPESDQPFYGTGYMIGNAHIYGPATELTIDVVGETDKGTLFKIPLNDAETFGDNTYIKFITPEEKRAKETGRAITVEEIKGLRLNFDLDITQDAEVELVIDNVSGSSIKGKGEGNLLIEINTNGLFKIYGDIAVFDGSYVFKYIGLIEKEFKIQPGGALAWDGEPLDAQLIDLVAVYSASTNPSPLLDNPINRSIPVNLEINLSGKLDELDPDFTFSFPTVNSSVRSELQYRLETKEERTNQALFLLSTGAFSSQLSDLSFTGTLTERLNGIINSFFNNSDNIFNVGLNIEAGENTPEYQTDNRVGLTFETRINPRIILNGNVGVPVGGASETVVAGEVQIDFLLNEEGTLTAKVFNRENTIQNFGEDIGYTQGIGLSYNVEFDTFKELMQKIFARASAKDKVQNKNTTKAEENPSPLPDFIGIKKNKR